ncbi:MAG: methyltransferase [Verrucomicrobia bacterium]|nr:methyltransferase [Verrucomicrobiota bacterium]
MNATEQSPPQHLLRLITGYWVTQLIHVVARLEIADRLADGSRTSEALAAECGVRARELHRVLRALAAEGLFTEVAPRMFAVTSLGELLQKNRPGSLHARAIVSGGKDYAAWGALLHSVQTGQPAFDRVHGADHFTWLQGHPGMAAAFHETMTQFAAQNYRAVVEAFDFGGFRCVADIGGGHGQLLALILARHPAIRGILFDAPHVIAGAGGPLREAGVASRCEPIGGDFFVSVPAGGDAYVLSHILHDWDDESALRLLATLRRAMTPVARLLIVEKIIPSGDGPSLAKLMDIHMLVLTGGLERTEEEFRVLLAHAGFQLERVVPTASFMSVLVAKPV